MHWCIVFICGQEETNLDAKGHVTQICFNRMMYNLTI